MRTGKCPLNRSPKTPRESLTRASGEGFQTWNPAELSSRLAKGGKEVERGLSAWRR